MKKKISCFPFTYDLVGDLNLKISWYHNGKKISAANRIQMYHDFGYVALDILNVRADDAGVYSVIARNQLGEAQVSATMVVESMNNSIEIQMPFFVSIKNTKNMFIIL